MPKVKYNPSTGKMSWDADTSKVQVAIITECDWTPKNCAAPTPCFLVGDNVPLYLSCVFSGIKQCSDDALSEYNDTFILEYQIAYTCSRSSVDCAYWGYVDANIEILYTASDIGTGYTFLEMFRVFDCNFWFYHAQTNNGATCYTSFTNAYDEAQCDNPYTNNCGYEGTGEITNPCA